MSVSLGVVLAHPQLGPSPPFPLPPLPLHTAHPSVRHLHLYHSLVHFVPVDAPPPGRPNCRQTGVSIGLSTCLCIVYPVVFVFVLFVDSSFSLLLSRMGNTKCFNGTPFFFRVEVIFEFLDRCIYKSENVMIFFLCTFPVDF